jgi:quinol monooxygenase YgiN
MAWIHVRHSVQDYSKWKQVYDQTASFKRGMGWQGWHLYSVNGNANDLLVMEQFDTVEHAQAFLHSPDLRAAMEQAGVSGPPDISIVEDIESGTA